MRATLRAGWDNEFGFTCLTLLLTRALPEGRQLEKKVEYIQVGIFLLTAHGAHTHHPVMPHAGPRNDPWASLAAIRVERRLLASQIASTRNYLEQVLAETLEQVARARSFCDESRRRRAGGDTAVRETSRFPPIVEGPS